MRCFIYVRVEPGVEQGAEYSRITSRSPTLTLLRDTMLLKIYGMS